MKKTFLFACISLMLSACSENLTTSIVTDTAGNELLLCHYAEVNDTIEMKLSDLAEDFQIVHFDNNENAIFGRGMATITENYIGISHNNGPYLLFDKKGNFLCHVGAQGKGPGEYAWRIYDAAIDDKNGEVFLAPFGFSKKVLVYNKEGKFTRELMAGNRLSKPRIKLDENGNLSVVQFAFKSDEEKNVIYHFNQNGDLTQKVSAGEWLQVEDFNQDLFAYHNVPELSFQLTHCDTLFHYNSKENRVIPKFRMDFGMMDDIPIHIYNEIPGYYIATIFGKGTIYVNKKKETAHYVKLVNDYCGNMKNGFVFKNGWAYSMYEPENLIMMIEKRLSEKDCSDKDRKILNQLMESIDEKGNNIMLMAKLKE